MWGFENVKSIICSFSHANKNAKCEFPQLQQQPIVLPPFPPPSTPPASSPNSPTLYPSCFFPLPHSANYVWSLFSKVVQTINQLLRCHQPETLKKSWSPCLFKPSLSVSLVVVYACSVLSTYRSSEHLVTGENFDLSDDTRIKKLKVPLTPYTIRPSPPLPSFFR